MIVKDNKLVFEEYFKGHDYKYYAPNHHGQWLQWDRDKLHAIHSDSKSITTACIGIAIDGGFIKSVNQSIFDYLPDHQHLKVDGKEKITIEHLVTMTSGLAWAEWNAPYSSRENDAIGIWFSGIDPLTYILEKPLVEEPGTHFNYAGGNTILLGEIIRYASGMGIDSFATRYLFEPIGVDTSFWEVTFPNGVIEAAGSLRITSRAMAKVGIVFLNNGQWKGRQIIPPAWVEKCAVPYGNNRRINIPGEASGRQGYAYGWWTKKYKRSGKTINMYSAGGWGGQNIMILPEINTVVVFTGGNYLSWRPPYKILRKYFLPAIV